VEDVQTIIIPFLEGVMEIEQAIVDDTSSTNQTAKSESKTKIAQLTEAKNGWQGLLDRNWKLYQDARAGKMAKNAVTHLVANQLLQDDNGVDNVKYINGDKAPNADKLRQVSAIRFLLYFDFSSRIFIDIVTINSFGGVGAMIAYSDTKENEKAEVISSSEVLSTEVGLKAEATVLVTSLGFTIAAELGYTGERETSNSDEDVKANARSRSFALGDADDGDYFDVQVCYWPLFGFPHSQHSISTQIFIDPVYGSFFFSTMSGQSRFVTIHKEYFTFIIL
jgi:hypothetical protein